MKLLAEEQVDYDHACFHAEYDNRTPLSAAATPGDAPEVDKTHVIWDVTVSNGQGYITFDADEHFYDGPFTFYTADGSVTTTAGTLVEADEVSDEDCEYLDSYAVVDPVGGTITLELAPDGVSVPMFEVCLDSVPADAEAGTDVHIEYTVQNTGNDAGTQDIEFLVNGSIHDAVSAVELVPGEPFADEFTYTTDSDDVPDVDVTVRSDDTTRTATVTITELSAPATFDVEFAGAVQSVAAGNELTVPYTVENTGDQTATQGIEFLVDGGLHDAVSAVELAPGETFADEFTYTTNRSDLPELDVEIRSNDTTRTATAPVTEQSEPTTFDINIVETPQSVTAGEELTVSYLVENTGDDAGTQDIEFLVDGSVWTQRPTLRLAPGETATGSFQYPATESDVPGVSVKVTTEDMTATGEVTVEEVPEPGAFVLDIDSLDPPTPVYGEQFDLLSAVENVGEETATRDIVLGLDGGQTLATVPEVTLEGGETRTVTFENVDPPNPGEATLVVASGDDEASVAVPVNDPVTELDLTAPEELAVGGTAEYAVTATRASGETEDVTDEAAVSVESNLLGVDTTVATVDGLQSGTAELVATVEELTTTADVQVVGPAQFVVGRVETNSPVAAGELLNVTAVVTNEGEQAGNVELTIGAEALDTATVRVTLAPGESTTETVSLVTTASVASELRLTAEAGDSSTAVPVTIEPQSDDSARNGDGSTADGDPPTNGNDTTTETDTGSADDSGPGFGILVGLAGLGATAGVLGRRFRGGPAEDRRQTDDTETHQPDQS